MYKNLKRTTIAKDVSVILQKNILVFSSCCREIKYFQWSFDAIDYVFAHTNSQVYKIFFKNIQKMMVQQYIFLQSLQYVEFLTCLNPTNLRLYPLLFLHSSSL